MDQQMFVTIIVTLSCFQLVSSLYMDDQAQCGCGAYPYPPPQVIQPNGVFPLGCLKTSCKNIKAADPNAPSGEYYIKIASNNKMAVKVYCEMGLNGGGYTFLHPTALVVMKDSDVQSIFTDRESFLMRYRMSNGKHPYAVLQQLPQYSSFSLKVGLNQNNGYMTPHNAKSAFLGPKFLYFGFIPKSKIKIKTVHGLRVNGHQFVFSNCDHNSNSYMALFPNFAEKLPSKYGKGWSGQWPLCKKIGDYNKHTPSSRAMPVDFFMFTELHFGGCGCYGTTDYQSNRILATTIGFR